MRVLIALGLAASLSACVTPITSAEPAALSQSEVATVQRAMSYDLYDPSAAQFRDVRAAIVTLPSGEKLKRICGQMNGKNQMGAYVGFENFSGVIAGGEWKQDPILGPCA